MELCFTLLYVVELGAKLLVYGPRRYWRTWRHRFDGSVSLGSLVAELVVVTPLIPTDPSLIRFIVITRLLRTLRILADLPQFRAPSQPVTAGAVPPCIAQKQLTAGAYIGHGHRHYSCRVHRAGSRLQQAGGRPLSDHVHIRPSRYPRIWGQDIPRGSCSQRHRLPIKQLLRQQLRTSRTHRPTPTQAPIRPR